MGESRKIGMARRSGFFRVATKSGNGGEYTIDGLMI